MIQTVMTNKKRALECSVVLGLGSSQPRSEGKREPASCLKFAQQMAENPQPLYYSKNTTNIRSVSNGFREKKKSVGDKI